MESKTCVDCQKTFGNLMPGDRCLECFEIWTSSRPDKLTREYWENLTDEQKWSEISNTFHTGMLIAMAYKNGKEIRLTMKDDIAELIRENTEVREENTALRKRLQNEPRISWPQLMAICWYRHCGHESAGTCSHGAHGDPVRCCKMNCPPWDNMGKHPGPHKIIPVPGHEGLGMCEVCGAAEGELTTECPRRETSYLERQAVFQGQGDFKDGHWISKL